MSIFFLQRVNTEKQVNKHIDQQTVPLSDRKSDSEAEYNVKDRWCVQITGHLNSRVHENARYPAFQDFFL